jgi:hypothetical protein
LVALAPGAPAVGSTSPRAPVVGSTSARGANVLLLQLFLGLPLFLEPCGATLELLYGVLSCYFVMCGQST